MYANKTQHPAAQALATGAYAAGASYADNPSALAAVPREPSLSNKVEQIASRAASINEALNCLDSKLNTLFGIGNTAVGQVTNGGAEPVHSIDSHLAYCSQEYANIEGRLMSILSLLEHRL